MKTALVVVDLQNAFCRPEGSFVRRGFAIADLARIVGTSRRLVEHAGRVGWPVVYTRLAYRPDYGDAGLLVANHPAIRELGGYVEGSFDAALIDVLPPAAPSDLVVRKTRYDPFSGTDLEAELRGRGVEELVVCGVTTNVCVESTVRRAHDLDFPVRLVEDAVSSYDPALHRASLETMGRHFARRVTSADVIGRASAAA
ncbi:MAG: isochorismatase family cysteine hydrolase [Myxococcota bacterium]